jgi:ribosome-binding factor A
VVSKVRAQRIADRIREELSEILINLTSDPRLSGVSVTDVKVDRELEYANIYYSSVEGSDRAEEILEGFRHAQGFLRSELARRIQLKSFPRLRFHYDPTFEKAENLERLFASLQEEKKDTGEQEFEQDNDAPDEDDVIERDD